MMRLAIWLVGLVLLGGAIATMVTTTVPADRGRDEINLLTIHELPVSPDDVLTQPVPLQKASPYAIELPYQWRQSSPARVEVTITSPNGELLSDSVAALTNSRANVFVQPIADGSYWQLKAAAFHAIRIPAGASGTVTLRLTRVDHEGGQLVLFASDRLIATEPAFDEQPDTRPALVERPDEYLDVQTEYGTPLPAWQKTSTYISRLQSVVPPWMPFPVPEVLLVLIVAAGLGFYSIILLTQLSTS